MLLINNEMNLLIVEDKDFEKASDFITIGDEINLRSKRDMNEAHYLTFFEGCKKVGFEENYITYGRYEKLLVEFRPKELCEASRNDTRYKG